MPLRVLDDSKQILLIVAAGPLQVPAFEEARRLGCRIVAVDRAASAPGLRLADKSYEVDIRHAEAVLGIAQSEKIRGVATICTDFAVRTVAAVAETLHLPGLRPDAAQRATDKRLMRRAFATFGVPSPGFREVADLESATLASAQFGYPVALKIPKSAGSRGVYRVNTPTELPQRYLQARCLEPTEDLLVEEWLMGPEVSVEGCCVGPEPYIVQITDKLLFDGANPVEVGHTQPSRLPLETQASIREVAAAAIRALGFEDCGFHAELKIASDGPRIIEIAARLGGDRISTDLTLLSTGINLVKAVIQIALGRKPVLEASCNRGAAIRYFQMPGFGILETVDGLDRLPSLPCLECLSIQTERGDPLRPGLPVRAVESSLDRYGYVLFSGSDARDAAAKADAAVNSVTFHVRPSGERSAASYSIAAAPSVV